MFANHIFYNHYLYHSCIFNFSDDQKKAVETLIAFIDLTNQVESSFKNILERAQMCRIEIMLLRSLQIYVEQQ